MTGSRPRLSLNGQGVKGMIHFAHIFCLKSTDLQFNSNERPQASVEEKHIHHIFLIIVLQTVLVTNEESFAYSNIKHDLVLATNRFSNSNSLTGSVIPRNPKLYELLKTSFA